MTPYLAKQAFFGPLFKGEIHPGLGLVVVIPCHDEPDLIGSLESLAVCELPECAVEVIVIVNESETAAPDVKARNRETVIQAAAWMRAHQEEGRQWWVHHASDLPARHAGVGLARKIGMDEACRRLEAAGQPDGIIACFDADSRCEPNYLLELEGYFGKYPEKQVVGIHFEHPMEGAEYPSEVYRAIVDYELHLRYFVRAQRWADFPYAVQTIGSSMAVRADAYQAQGGMPRRKAGEDFYFVHKYTPLGVYGHIATTRVIPSPRPSHRVPFGTGRDVQRQLALAAGRTTYAPDTFMELKELMGAVPLWWDTDPKASVLPKAIHAYLGQGDWLEKVEEARAHSASRDTFVKRMLRWLDAFQMVKFSNFSRDHFYPDVPVTQAAGWLLRRTGFRAPSEEGRDLLLLYRELDRLGN